jgi:hypothetical protein
MFELAVKPVCASDEAFKSGKDAPIFVPDGLASVLALG